MNYFYHCVSCEAMALGAIVAAAFVVDYVVCKRRKWGENPKKWGKK